MSSWEAIGNEIREAAALGGPYDVVRRKYLRDLHQLTGRDVISYYSGWIQKPELAAQYPARFSIDDGDKNGFMAVIHGLSRSSGLDLILHTPGGAIAATESIVDYFRAMFGSDIRVIVPQLAMSAGTMISCASREIVMGKHSSLGPIDPQLGGIPAHGVIEEFAQAAAEIRQDSSKIPLWQVIISQYRPTFIGECQKAIDLSEEMVRGWLMTGMFSGLPDAPNRAEAVINGLGSHTLTKAHDRHISINRAREYGLMVTELETDSSLQEAVLSVHHAMIHTLASTAAVKIIENHQGQSFIHQLHQGPTA